jgi:hypothetical protein
VLQKVMTTYRTMNPQAQQDEFIKTTGAMACAILGLPIQVAAPQPQGQQPPAPLTPGPIVRSPNGLPPYSPAGTATVPPAPQKIDNPWDRLSRIMAADDQGHFDT